MEVSRSQLAVYAAAALVIAVIGARYLRGGEPRADGERPVPVRVSSGATAGAGAGGLATVHVSGEVRRPGVYRLRPGQRVDDAVRLAGGPTGKAELTGVNLAAKVEDGRQVIVPARATGGAASAAAAPAAGAAAPAPGVPLNLNTATAEQLDQLDGIGPATAQKILAYRQQHGGFRSVGELDRVPGIGPGRMAGLKDKVTV